MGLVRRTRPPLRGSDDDRLRPIGFGPADASCRTQPYPQPRLAGKSRSAQATRRRGHHLQAAGSLYRWPRHYSLKTGQRDWRLCAHRISPARGNRDRRAAGRRAGACRWVKFGLAGKSFLAAARAVAHRPRDETRSGLNPMCSEPVAKAKFFGRAVQAGSATECWCRSAPRAQMR